VPDPPAEERRFRPVRLAAAIMGRNAAFVRWAVLEYLR
jgi:hypothetical protein